MVNCSKCLEMMRKGYVLKGKGKSFIICSNCMNLVLKFIDGERLYKKSYDPIPSKKKLWSYVCNLCFGTNHWRFESFRELKEHFRNDHAIKIRKEKLK